jgi:hypothetical protein
VNRLLTVASAAVADSGLAAGPRPDIKGADQLFELLFHKNGFHAFESALHVFPSGSPGAPGWSLEEWNDRRMWIGSYGELVPQGALFFAEDVFGGQFALIDGAVFSFEPETAELTAFADDVDGWAEKILTDYNVSTGYPAAHDWQVQNGQILSGHRLIPRIPFVFGGTYTSENMILVEAVTAMRYRARTAVHIAELPDGAQLKFNPAVVEKLRCASTRQDASAACHCFD